MPTRKKATALIVTFGVVFLVFIVEWYPLLIYLANTFPYPTPFADELALAVFMLTIVAIAFVGGLGLVLLSRFDQYLMAAIRGSLAVPTDRLTLREAGANLVASWVMTFFVLVLVYVLPTEASISAFLPSSIANTLTSARVINQLIQPGAPYAALSQVLLGISGSLLVFFLRMRTVLSKGSSSNKFFPRLAAYLGYLSVAAIIDYVYGQPFTPDSQLVLENMVLFIFLFTTFASLTLIPLERGLKRVVGYQFQA